MDNFLPIIYLFLFVALLSGASWLVFRQIWKNRQVESSLSRLESKLKQEKGTAQEYYELGSIYLEKKLFAQSVVLFQKALKADDEENPVLPLIYNALGFGYFAQEQYDLAIRQYKESLRLAPDYVTAWNNLGHVYERKKLTAQALEAYEEALKYEPKNETASRRAESLRKRLVPSG
jgi:tetratricopeptide (TPR) repeat protein